MININVFIHDSADVSKYAKIGSGTKIWNQAQVRENAIIGNNCIIGKSSYIDINVIIGNNVKIQNFVSIYDGVIIEDDVFIGPSVTFTNDLYPRAISVSRNWSKTLIKTGASIGAGSTIVCGITIGIHSMIGAGSVVTKNVPNHGLVYGNPARLKSFVCFCGKKLSNLIKKDKNTIVYKCEDCNKEIVIDPTDFKQIYS